MEHCVCRYLKVEGLEARVGRRGHIKVRGGLPVTPSTLPLPSVPVPEPNSQGKEAEEDAINISVQALELRVRNVYTGWCPALKRPALPSGFLQLCDKKAVLYCTCLTLP